MDHFMVCPEKGEGRIGSMHCTDISARKECHSESKEAVRLRKTWKVLSRAVYSMIVIWFLAAFARMFLLLGFIFNKWSFGERSPSDIIRYVRLMTGAGMVMLTIKMLVLLVYRAEWLKQIRRRSGLPVVYRYSLRWLFIIPAQCALDVLFVGWAFFIENFMFMEQYEQGTVMGHPSGLVTLAALFRGVPVITLAAAAISMIVTCISCYRSKRNAIYSQV